MSHKSADCKAPKRKKNSKANVVESNQQKEEIILSAMVTKVNMYTIAVKRTFPDASQNSDSPYHWTAKTLMTLFWISAEAVNGGL